MTSSDLSSLANGLSKSSHLLLPTDAAYGDERLIWNRLYNELPTAIVQASTPTDVGLAVRWCVDHGIYPRIRCGGHSFAGYSMGGTVIIDVRGMNEISVQGSGEASIGAGANLGEVYATLRCAYDRTIPAGTCAGVGISGITMAGGMGLLMRERRLTIDVLNRAEVVLWNGTTVVCSATEHPDLFWALRGGGSGSFGVVTKWSFSTFPYQQRMSAQAKWHWKDFVPVFAAWEEWLASLPATCFAGLSVFAAASSAPSFAVTVVGNTGTEKVMLGYLDALASTAGIPIVNTPTPTPQSGSPCPPVEERDMDYGFHKSRLTNSPIGAAGAAQLKASFDARAADPVLYATTGFLLNDGLGGAVASVGSTDTAWVHRNALYSSQLGAGFNSSPKSESAQAACQDWIRGIYLGMSDHYDGGCYQGYWDPDVEDWTEAYYGQNFHRLQMVKSQYDPNNIFRFQRSIPPL